MLRKKNYKDEDHFTQYFSVSIPRKNGSKLTLYYKRYRPAIKVQQSVYQVVNKKEQPKPAKSEYPLDRTLEVISFDSSLQSAKVYFKKIGKVRKFIEGESKYGGKTAYYCIVIFKFEFDLVKCFRDEYFQQLINRENKEEKPAQDLKEDYNNELITTYLKDQLQQVSKLQELHNEGYNVITNKLGQFKVDYEANQKSIEDLPQIRKQRKLQAKNNKLQKKYVNKSKEEEE